MKVNQSGLWLSTLAMGVAMAAAGAGAPGRIGSVTGTVGRVDAASRTLDVVSRDGTRTLTVPPGAVVVRQIALTLPELRVGDSITVSGVPRQIDARSVDVGAEPPSGLQARLTRPAPGVAVAPPPGQLGGTAAPTQRSARRAARVRVSGTVAATRPSLLLRLSDGSDVQIRASAGTLVHRMVPTTLADLKWGERVRVTTDPATSTVREVRVGIPPARRIPSARSRITKRKRPTLRPALPPPVQ
jgi:hypothetical protein